MARKVILDVDPGIDDALAISLALLDPRLEVVAITAVAGNVSAQQATRNVQAIVEQLDPPRWPRIGAATEPENGRPADATRIHGPDGLGGANFQVAELHNLHPSEKVLADALRRDPGQVTVICLGPLTNISRLLRKEGELVQQNLGDLLIMGGAVRAPGNVTPAAEFNMHVDPAAARDVFHAPVTKTLIPLDATDNVVFGLDILDALPSEEIPTGKFLRKVLPYLFRAYRNELGLEGVHFHDAVALLAATDPQLFALTPMSGDVETAGRITSGATIFDRRPNPARRPNMEVAMEVDEVAIRDLIFRRLASAR